MMKTKKKLSTVVTPPETVRQSIKELRKIYSEKSDAEFVAWYSRRYRVNPATVRKVLQLQ